MGRGEVLLPPECLHPEPGPVRSGWLKNRCPVNKRKTEHLLSQPGSLSVLSWGWVSSRASSAPGALKWVVHMRGRVAWGIQGEKWGSGIVGSERFTVSSSFSPPLFLPVFTSLRLAISFSTSLFISPPLSPILPLHHCASPSFISLSPSLPPPSLPSFSPSLSRSAPTVWFRAWVFLIRQAFSKKY